MGSHAAGLRVVHCRAAGRGQALVMELIRLDKLISAEAAEGTHKQGWTAWLLSPIYTQPEESEEEKQRKSRVRQERQVEKVLKERRLESQRAWLREERDRCAQAEGYKLSADASDDVVLQSLEATVRAREAREGLERWKKESDARFKREEEQAELHRQQEQQAREAELARILKAKRQQNASEADRTKGAEAKARQSSCSHRGFWTETQGFATCAGCQNIGISLLECPGCGIKACPKCQVTWQQWLAGGDAWRKV